MGAVRHDAHGWWLRDAGIESVAPAPPLVGSTDAEVVIVGGGYTGMWAAWFLSERIDPGRIVLIEAEICGSGPSGRNGGFCQGLADSIGQLAAAHGDRQARDLVERTEELAAGVGTWAAGNGVDIHFRAAGELIVDCGAGQDSGWAELLAAAEAAGLPGEFERLSQPEVRSRCDSPVFGHGLFAPRVATVHPGRLALGLRAALLDRGVRIHERTEARSLAADGSGVGVATRQGSVSARSGVLACGVASCTWPGLGREVTMTSSHMVITEPVPDVLDEIGWTGGEAIVDGRTLVHYFRTTADSRIAFGWGGGVIGFGARPRRRDSIDPGLVARVESDLLRFFPQLAGRRIEHAWGGPIDASPRHLPAVRRVAEGAWHAAFGYTGNGVGPSRSCGNLLAELALDRDCDPGPLAPLLVADPTRVPPEPFRWLGGSAIMGAIDAIERAGESGERPAFPARVLAGLPDRLGYSIGR